MKDKITTIIVVMIALLLLSPFFLTALSDSDISLNPNDYARITDVDYKAVVTDEPDSRGKIVVTERLTFDIHAASSDNLFWELWRDLCEDTVDGVDVTYKVNSVKQILEDGTEIVYEESPRLYWDDSDYLPGNTTYGPGKWYHSEGPYDEDSAQYECVFFYVNGLYRQQVVFEIEYEMYNASLRYNDCSDLYISLYSGSTIKYLNSFKAQILFPDDKMPSKGNYNVFTYGTEEDHFPVQESDTLNPGYHTFYFDLDKEDLKFKSYNEYIEFDLVAYGEDKQIFTQYASYNDYSYDDVLEEIINEHKGEALKPTFFLLVKISILFLSLAASVLILVDAFTIRKRARRNHCYYTPVDKIEYFRDIPSDLDPNFASALVFCKEKPLKDDSHIYSSLLLSLVRKKYILLQEYSGDNFLIIFPDAMEEREPLTFCEMAYYNLLIRHSNGSPILMKHFQERISQDYEYTTSFVKTMDHSIVNIGVDQRYFQKADYKEPQRKLHTHGNLYITAGIVLITLVNLICYFTRVDLAFGSFFLLGAVCLFGGFYIKSKAAEFVLLTQYGEDEYAKWHGLYNFLNSDTLMSERTHVELPIWEKYLVYATAFGISEKVSKAISIRCPEAASSQMLGNSCYHSVRLHHSSRSFRSAVHSGSFSSGSSHGGGFGYGGGGRGGGGGGGGH